MHFLRFLGGVGDVSTGFSVLSPEASTTLRVLQTQKMFIFEDIRWRSY